MNASWGQRYGGITPLDAINDTCKSHPLYGGSTIIAGDGRSYNRIYDVDHRAAGNPPDAAAPPAHDAGSLGPCSRGGPGSHACSRTTSAL